MFLQRVVFLQRVARDFCFFNTHLVLVHLPQMQVHSAAECVFLQQRIAFPSQRSIAGRTLHYLERSLWVVFGTTHQSTALGMLRDQCAVVGAIGWGGWDELVNAMISPVYHGLLI